MGVRNQTIRLDDCIKRGRKIKVYFNDCPVDAYEGETIATALTAAGHMTLQVHNHHQLGVYCNIGQCHSCLVKVDGRAGVKACSTFVSDGQKIEARVVTSREG